MDSLFYQESDEELLAALFVTHDYASELKSDSDTVVDYNKGKNLTPWVLNKRLKSI